ncbi:aldo/keto reductase [Methanosphaera sp.]
MEKLGFGMMRLPQLDENPEHIDQELLNRMVDSFMKNGFNYFDTAYPYHNGASEKAFKKALVDRYPRESFILADKLPIFFVHKDEDIEPIFNEQLERCGVDYFDYYMLHNLCTWNEYAITDADSFKFIREKKEEGKIRKIGFSFHDEPEYLEKILSQHPEVDFVQLQINYLDWEDKGVQARRCYEIAEKYEVPVIVMEPVRGGALADVPEEAEKLLKDYDDRTSVASYAIRFCAGLDNVIMVLAGVSDIDQMEDNIKTMINFKEINEEEQKLLDKVSNIIHSKITVPCTSCNYCLESCPKNIYISKYFELYNAEKQTEWKGFSQQLNYYITYIEKDQYGRASDCINCGLCIEQCPQHIDIPKFMKDVSDEFDPAADATNEFFS